MALRVKGKGIRKWILEHYSTEKQAERFSRSDHTSLAWGAQKTQSGGGCLWASQRGRGVCAPHGAKRPHLNIIDLLLLLLLLLILKALLLLVYTTTNTTTKPYGMAFIDGHGIYRWAYKCHLYGHLYMAFIDGHGICRWALIWYAIYRCAFISIIGHSVASGPMFINALVLWLI